MLPVERYPPPPYEVGGAVTGHGHRDRVTQEEKKHQDQIGSRVIPSLAARVARHAAWMDTPRRYPGRMRLPAVEVPDADGRWIVPRGVSAFLEELELCGVPADATPEEARRVLALNGVWVRESSMTLCRALKVRRSQAEVPLAV